ncbi:MULTISPECIES: hypothetical protein [Actinoplanes]|uniref:hypothetical protein n=1 Tax=Actinoplanes TaxID=1865 RepID=UPI000ACC8938|nr:MULTISPECIES: hypothetical protein [Actinoplanes]
MSATPRIHSMLVDARRDIWWVTHRYGPAVAFSAVRGQVAACSHDTPWLPAGA